MGISLRSGDLSGAVQVNNVDAVLFNAGGVASTLSSLTATALTGAITVTVSPSPFKFSSSSLTNGVGVTRMLNANATLVVPSGATLGAVSAVGARVAVVAIDNAGVVEVAVINIAGGNDLSETGVISTTAISTTSTANNVFYSTTARTSVAYRVVGIVDAVNTTGAWAVATLVRGSTTLPPYRMVLPPSPQNATGSNIDFPDIPSWAKRVTITLNGVSTNGTLVPGIQFGTVTSVETTGYIGSMFVSSGTAVANATLSSMLPFHSANDATQIYSGVVSISLLSPNVYSFSANIGGSSGRITIIGGSKTLASVLTTIRLTTGGVDVFDAGSINIMYEG